MKKENLQARLVIYDLPTMTDEEHSRLLEWFKKSMKEIQKGRYRFRKKHIIRLLK